MDRMFGLFTVGGAEIAVPADALQEAISWPAVIVPRPMAPSCLLGTFSLRGMLIPAVDLRVLLSNGDVPPAAPTGREKIVIVHHAGGQIGLVVDVVSQMLRLPTGCAEIKLAAQAGDAQQNGTTGSLFASLFSLDDGARIVHVLDIERLFTLPQANACETPQAKACETPEANACETPQAKGRQQIDTASQAAMRSAQQSQYLIFRCAGLDFAISTKVVRRIVDAPLIEQTFLRNAFYRGFSRVAGKSVPVLNLPALIEAGENTLDAQQLLILDANGRMLGLPISRVTALTRRSAGDILPLPRYGVARPEMFAGLVPDAREDGGGALLLDHAALLSHEQVAPVVRVHAELYDQPSEHGATEANLHAVSSAESMRVGFIAYTAGQQFASPLFDVDAILDVRTQILRIGGQSQYLVGMIRHRDKMLPLVDLRCILGQPARDASAQPKILIVGGGQEPFGFVVDSVDSIIFLTPSQEMIVSDQVAIPPGSHPGIAGLLQLVMIKGGGVKLTLTMLELGAFATSLQDEAAPAPAQAAA